MSAVQIALLVGWCMLVAVAAAGAVLYVWWDDYKWMHDRPTRVPHLW
jgi:hypothetical protein